MRIGIGVSLLVLSVATLSAQTTPTPAATVRGRVVETGSGTAIRKAAILLWNASPPAGPSPSPQTPARPVGTAQTDAEGRFSLAGVPPGRFLLVVEKPGYTAPKRAKQTFVDVPQNGDPAEVTVQLDAPGVIVGHVVDADGEPIAGVTVVASSARGNRPGLGGAIANAQTNDLGEYRLFHVPPGKYLLLANPPGARILQPDPAALETSPRKPIPQTTYYPGTVDRLQATPVTVDAHGEVRGIDIPIQMGTPFRVSGRMPQGLGEQQAMVMLMPRGDGLSMGGTASNTQVLPNGRFVIDGVAPGKYVLTAVGQLGSDGTNGGFMSRSVEVVNSDVEVGTLELQKPVAVKAHVQWPEGRKEKSQLVITVYPAAPGSGGAIGAGVGEPDAQGNLEFPQLTPGEYEMLISNMGAADDLYAAQVQFGGRDVLKDGLMVEAGDNPVLKIVLKDHGAEAKVSVVDEDKHPFPAAVVYFAQPSRTHGYALTLGNCTTDAAGTCSVIGMPPGEYKALALPPGENFQVMDRGAWDGLEERTQTVKLELNSPQTITLTARALD